MSTMTIAEARKLGLLPVAKAKPQSDRERLEDSFNAAWLQVGCGLPLPVTQYRFAPPRRWRFDFAWPDPAMLAVEIQGGTWIKGRHTSGSSREGEYEKMRAAAIAGWCVLQYGTVAMKDAAAVAAEVAGVLRARLKGTNQ